MSQASTVLDRAEVVRQKTLTILGSLMERAGASGLPDPASSLAQHRQKLVENTYQVLVVGEAKRGKSTFVNALIGRDILPTDVDIATSQVFRVCAAEREAYRLCYEDDSRQEIKVGDLARFGSQVVADAGGLPRLDQIIRWIEVDVPVRFLPANLRILDTPGLGALYAGHALITDRFVPHADAVLFILDSQAPIGELEIQFIAKLLEVTRNIFFVQTKIDQFRREVWQEIQKRNQEILETQFGDRLADKRVWPISSINLRKAAQTGDDDYLMVSRHKELSLALHAFLFRVSGWGRSAEAVVMAAQYHAASGQILAARLAALTGESKQKRAESQQRAMERRRQFEADWGERGQKRHDLLQSIQKAAAIGRQAIRSGLQPGGDVERHFRARIEELTSAAESAELLRTLPQQVEAHVLNLWGEVRKTTEAKCTEVLAPFALAAEGVMRAPATESISSQLRNAAAPDVQTGGLEMWLKALRSATFATAAAPLIVNPALYIVGAATAPFWLVGAVAIVAVGIPTVLVEKRVQLRAGKQELLRSLADVLQRLRNHLLSDVDMTGGRFNRVDECFSSLEGFLSAKIGQLASQKLADAQAESDRLGEQSRLDDEARQEKAEEARRQLSDWDVIGLRLQEVGRELEELERGQRSAVGGQASGQ
jgi:GTP-binding protein EngB required for normal cell division